MKIHLILRENKVQCKDDYVETNKDDQNDISHCE